MKSPARVHRLVETLLEGEEDLFELGLRQELSTRKEDLCQVLSVKIFEKLQDPKVYTQVDLNEEVTHFLKLLEDVEKRGTVRLQFKNASILNISEQELKPVKYLFDNLSSNNQKELAKKLFENPQSFKQTIEFAKKVKGLLS